MFEKIFKKMNKNDIRKRKKETTNEDTKDIQQGWGGY